MILTDGFDQPVLDSAVHSPLKLKVMRKQGIELIINIGICACCPVVVVLQKHQMTNLESKPFPQLQQLIPNFLKALLSCFLALLQTIQLLRLQSASLLPLAFPLPSTTRQDHKVCRLLFSTMFSDRLTD